MAESDAGTSTRTVDRAIGLLLRVCNSDKPPTLVEVARESDLSPATALRLLRTLEGHRLVEKDDEGGYRPGTGMMQVAATILGATPLYQFAQAHLEELAATTNESCYLAIRGPGETALYVRQAESQQEIRHVSWVGRTVPLEGTAIGTALRGSAQASPVIQRSSVELHVAAVAIGISIDSTNVTAAISIVGPSFRLSDADLARFGELLTQHAGALQEELIGGRTPSEHPQNARTDSAARATK
ncbi:MAG TPA: helix-turn-helix domain-containing protein [Vicinamibacterales bacterium]|nr:helix-turn-helix domain-containing protein [Vicinamibacterales bacterium]